MTWLGDDLLVVGGTEFVVTHDEERYRSEDSEPNRFVVAKRREMVVRLAGLIDDLRPRRIVELGIYKGGSAALLASLAQPQKLTAIELAGERVGALDEFISAQEFDGVVSPHYGVDQGNRPLLEELVDSDHRDEPLDLVVDDASHFYRETRSSFEVLFPRLRPGGKYVIEDWAWAHFPEMLWQSEGGWFHDRPALTNLIVEIMMIAGTGPDLVSHIETHRDTVTLTRGPLSVDGAIRLEEHYCNRGLPYRPLL